MKGKIQNDRNAIMDITYGKKIDVNTYNDWIVRIKAKERMQTKPNTKGYSKVISRKRNF